MSPWLQTWHIVRKDARHLWPEILASFVLLVALAYIMPRETKWLRIDDSDTQLIVKIGNVLRVLLVLVWATLIARVVHEEPLIGTRAAWLTRPYRRLPLLAAKIAFVALFLCVPFLLMQITLQARAGVLHPESIYGLCANMGMICLFVLLPFGAIATVTRTLGQFFLTGIGSILYFGLLLYILTEILKQPATGSYAINASWGVGGFLTAASIAIAFLTRRTLLTRYLLIATPLFGCVVATLPDTAIRAVLYPSAQPSTAFPMRMSVRPAMGVPPAPLEEQGGISFTIPIHAEGIPAGEKIQYRADRVQVDAANAVHWTSPWHSSTNFEEKQESEVNFDMPRRVFNRIGGSPVHLTVSFDIERLIPVSSMTTNTMRKFAAPGGGICTVTDLARANDVACRFPMSQPGLLLARVGLSRAPCPLDGSVVPASATDVSEGMLHESDEPFSFDPVKQVWLGINFVAPVTTHHHSYCAGIPITFVPFRSAGRMELRATAESVSLSTYWSRPVIFSDIIAAP